MAGDVESHISGQAVYHNFYIIHFLPPNPDKPEKL
jgi:hypothetical protein